MNGGSGILYLGDSENDNPAFRKVYICRNNFRQKVSPKVRQPVFDWI